MTEAQLNAAARSAIVACVRTVEELETLLFLARHRTRYSSPDMVAAETGLPARLAAAALEALASRNLLDVRIGTAVLYKLDPTSSERRDMVERTLEAARDQRSQVLRAILSPSAARDFADAFRVARKGGDG
jgi:hypothetical protein